MLSILFNNAFITYHVIRCVQEDINEAEFFEALNVALIVGGSITIPHVRQAVETYDECRHRQKKGLSLNL